ncbi:hypothetical protein Drorol1_Dr00012833 [Drosera rotundifolia]
MPIIRCHSLIRLVNGTLSRPTGNDQDVKVLAWLRLNQMVLAWIASSLSDDVLLQVVHCTFAREIWQTLEVLYGAVSRSRVQGVKRELHSHTKVQFDSVVAAIQLATPLPSLDSLAATLADFEQRLKDHHSTSLFNIALVAAADQRSSPGVSLFGRGSGHGSSSNQRGNCQSSSSRGSGLSSRGRNQTRAAPITEDSNSVYCY